MLDGVAIFQPGDLVAGRYKIARFIARGGAAEVYEAEDLELRHRVALKAIRREHLQSSVAIERFKREVHLARQVTHPNVCRIYDLGQEQRGLDSVLFLTMELLVGETLHERIHRRGPMSTQEALPLIRQMAAGLEATQQVGVVHRDFKSGNVILVPSADGGGERAVIADFGMARMANEDSSLVVTREDLVVGSPAYMAPEQVESGPISAATDIYAVGVVLYEMLTGRFPFQAESALATALMRLKERPPAPRTLVPDLDERWDRAIMRCLERDPERRFAAAGDLVRALEGESVPQPGVGRRRRWLALAGFAAVIVVAMVWLLSRGDGEPAPGSPSPTAAFEARPSVALIGFRNLSGKEDAAWLSTALSEMLAMEIAAGEKVRVIPGENVTRTKLDLGLSDTEGLAAETLAQVGKILGSELVVAGSYLLAGSGEDREIRLDLRVREVAGGETIARISERGTEAEVLNLVENAGRSLRRELGVGQISEAEVAALKALLPTGPRSARLYAEGLEQLRRHDASAALETLQSAVEIDPENPMIHSALASAWATLGYREKAREGATRAFELSGDLSRQERLWVEARYHEATGNRQEAVSIYGVLWGFFPDNLEYGLRLAKAQTAVGQGETALETIAGLRALPPPVGQDPRIDLAESEAARSLAQYQRQQESAARAARTSRELGARLLVARARELEAGAWRDLGEPARALAAYEEAKETHLAAGHRGPAARILIAIAKIRRYQGEFDKARALNEEALAVAREIGDQGSVKHALNTLAIIHRQQGRLREAQAMHELELETNRRLGDGRSVQVALTSLGVVQRLLGQLEGAAVSFGEALELGRESGNQRSVEINLNMLGEVLMLQGRLAAARKSFEEALATNLETGSPRGRAYYLSSLADVDLAAGDLAAARAGYLEALAIRESLGEATNVAFSKLSLGSLAILEGRYDDAVTLAGEAAAHFRGGDQPDARGGALAMLAEAWLGQGDLGEASAAITEAGALVERSENRGVRLRVARTSAEVAAASGKHREAKVALGEVVREARAVGFVDLALEAELALGRVEKLMGENEAAATRLSALAKEAEERGFSRISSQASSLVPGD